MTFSRRSTEYVFGIILKVSVFSIVAHLLNLAILGCEPTPIPEPARTMIIGGVPVAERDYLLPKDTQPVKK